MTTKFSIGSIVTKQAIRKEFGAHALGKIEDKLESQPRAKREQRKFKIIAELPAPEDVKKLVRDSFTTSIGDAAESAQSDAEQLKDELQDWFDNPPESFQGGQKGNELEDAISEFDSINWPEAPEFAADLKCCCIPNEDSNSRSDRACESAALLRAAGEVARQESETDEEREDDLTPDPETKIMLVPDGEKPKWTAEQRDELASFSDECDEAADQLEGICFPGMY
jgi:hypothetical protein